MNRTISLAVLLLIVTLATFLKADSGKSPQLAVVSFANDAQRGGQDPWLWAINEYCLGRLRAIPELKVLDSFASRNAYSTIRSGLLVFDSDSTEFDKFNITMPCDYLLYLKSVGDGKTGLMGSTRLTAELHSNNNVQKKEWILTGNDPLKFIVQLSNWIIEQTGTKLSPAQQKQLGSYPTKEPEAVIHLAEGMSAMTSHWWDDPLMVRMPILQNLLKYKDFTQGFYYFMQQASNWNKKAKQYPDFVYAHGPVILQGKEPWSTKSIRYLILTEKPVLYSIIKDWFDVDDINMDMLDDLTASEDSIKKEKKKNISIAGQVAACIYMGDFLHFRRTVKRRHWKDLEPKSEHEIVEKLNYLLDKSNHQEVKIAAYISLLRAGEKPKPMSTYKLDLAKLMPGSKDQLMQAVAEQQSVPAALLALTKQDDRTTDSSSNESSGMLNDQWWVDLAKLPFNSKAYWLKAATQDGDEYAARFALDKLVSWSKEDDVIKTVTELTNNGNIFLQMAAMEFLATTKSADSQDILLHKLAAQWLPLRLFAAQLIMQHPTLVKKEFVERARTKAESPAVKALLTRALNNGKLPADDATQNEVGLWSFGSAPVRADIPLNAQEITELDDSTEAHVLQLVKEKGVPGFRLRQCRNIIDFTGDAKNRLGLYSSMNKSLNLPYAKYFKMINLGDEDLNVGFSWQKQRQTFAICYGVPLKNLEKQEDLTPGQKSQWREFCFEMIRDGHAWVAWWPWVYFRSRYQNVRITSTLFNVSHDVTGRVKYLDALSGYAYGDPSLTHVYGVASGWQALYPQSRAWFFSGGRYYAMRKINAETKLDAESFVNRHNMPYNKIFSPFLAGSEPGIFAAWMAANWKLMSLSSNGPVAHVNSLCDGTFGQNLTDMVFGRGGRMDAEYLQYRENKSFKNKAPKVGDKEDDGLLEMLEGVSEEEMFLRKLTVELAEKREEMAYAANIQLAFTQDACRVVASLPKDYGFLKQKRVVSIAPGLVHLNWQHMPALATGFFSKGFAVLNNPDALRDLDLKIIDVIILKSGTDLQQDVEQKLKVWAENGGLLYLQNQVSVTCLGAPPEYTKTVRSFTGLGELPMLPPAIQKRSSKKEKPIQDIPFATLTKLPGKTVLSSSDQSPLCQLLPIKKGTIIWDLNKQPSEAYMKQLKAVFVNELKKQSKDWLTDGPYWHIRQETDKWICDIGGRYTKETTTIKGVDVGTGDINPEVKAYGAALVLKNWQGKYIANQGDFTLLSRWPIEEFTVNNNQVTIKTRGWFRLVYTGSKSIALDQAEKYHQVDDNECKTWFVQGTYYHKKVENGTKIAIFPGSFTPLPARTQKEINLKDEKLDLKTIEQATREKVFHSHYPGKPFTNKGSLLYEVSFSLK